MMNLKNVNLYIITVNKLLDFYERTQQKTTFNANGDKSDSIYGLYVRCTKTAVPTYSHNLLP